MCPVASSALLPPVLNHQAALLYKQQADSVGAIKIRFIELAAVTGWNVSSKQTSLSQQQPDFDQLAANKAHHSSTQRLRHALVMAAFHLVDKDWHSERRLGEVNLQVVQVVLPLALPGQVHQGGPFGPAQLYQLALLIDPSIVARHLPVHLLNYIELLQQLCFLYSCKEVPWQEGK